MNQPMQSQPEQERPRGLRGLLSNPDLFDRLAIGLGGMTLNPNTALMQMSADRIAGRREERTTRETGNRTAEWLRSQGRDDLAGAVLSGALGSRDAVTIAYQPEAQGQILSADQMRQMFPGTQIEDGLYNLRPDGTANKVGGGGNVFNMGGTPTIGPIPPGYQAVQDPETKRYTFEPIEGGPAAAEAAAAGEKDQMRADLAQASSDVVITASRRAREASDARRVGGVLGPLAAMNPATANAEIVRQVRTLQSMAAAENINAMRQASPTGGALGNASDADIMLLKQKSGALDPFSPNFERDLDDYERTLLRTIHGFDAGNLIYDQTRNPLTPPPITGSTINGVTVGEPYQ